MSSILPYVEPGPPLINESYTPDFFGLFVLMIIVLIVVFVIVIIVLAKRRKEKVIIKEIYHGSEEDFCGSCGAKIDKMTPYCPNCGAEL